MNRFFTPDFLTQTSWDGTMEEVYHKEGEKYVEYYNVRYNFYTNKEGKEEIYDSKGEWISAYDFSYTAENKMLVISVGQSVPDCWFIIEKSKDKIVLEIRPNTGYSTTVTMTLHRKH